jgi:hypothetical protein
VLLCWQMWASFGYRAGSAVTWQGNRSIPGGYPPPGVSRHPSYAVHCLYLIVIRSFVHCRTLFICCRMPFVFICTLLSFVCCHSYVVVRMSLSFGPLYVVVHCSLFFVHCCTLFIVLCTLFVCHRTPFVFVLCTLFVRHCTPFVFVRCHTLFIILRMLSLWQCT